VGWQSVEEVLHRRERGIFVRIKEPKRRRIHAIRRAFATQSLAKRTARSQDDFFNGLLDFH